MGNGPTTIISPDNIVDGTLHDISIIISSAQMFNSTADRKSNFLNWTCAVNIDDHEDSSVSSFNDNNVINRVITQRKKNYFKLFVSNELQLVEYYRTRSNLHYRLYFSLDYPLFEFGQHIHWRSSYGRSCDI